MRHCSVCKIECEKPLRCSRCLKTIYCSVECQKVDWKEHKRTVCIRSAIFSEVEKMMKQWHKPGTMLGDVNGMFQLLWKERQQNPTPAMICDGCFWPFRGTAPHENDKDNVRHVGDAFKRCTTCDYTICKNCARPDMQGVPYIDRPPGTCHCPKANFGVSYCLSSPCYLDGGGLEPYYGDRHPNIAGSGYDEGAFEPKERQCRTCGVTARCLKKKHLKDTFPGVK
ncbi:hypothetical protein DEU56DRAFT_531879 [Suillus clintonianus]|uniref:uncharacterized protein n=1 Tax=Suillus clintonianus TaxID=1904413 RepID=UPI001B87D35B|nr:uncharacterized protein DEU56DRAFT_531879 [Suillus clintonianus]KAG2127235.1 hypothetical protein DEU56DRAFT_531879 [Suillus clintonianus]